MEAWLIYYKESAEYNEKYIQFYKEEGEKLNVNIKLILVENIEFGVKNNLWFLRYQNQEIKKPDFAICRAIYPLLSKHLEFMGIRVFNNSFVAEVCNDKAKTYQYLAKTGIKMVDSSFYRNQQVEEVLSKTVPETVTETASGIVTKTVQGTVIKAVDGHGGSQVFLTDLSEVDTYSNDNDSSLQNIINGLNGSDVVVQPFIGSLHQDLRVYVIGMEIIAAVLRTSKEGFRSNYSLGGTVSLYQLSIEERSIVEIILKQFDFGLVGIDFIIDDNRELIFNEIEDVVGARMLYQCTDVNIVERYLQFIVGCIQGKSN
jgi:gamma-F420-2:alpha-L-glutamate ligase